MKEVAVSGVFQLKCSAPECLKVPIYKSRSQPFCAFHIDQIFLASGLEPLTPYVNKTERRSVKCSNCGYESTCTFAKLLGNPTGYVGCDVCRWKAWAEVQRAFMASVVDPLIPQDVAVIAAAAEHFGFEYIEQLTNPCLAGDPHSVKCKRCCRIEICRPVDFQWGCPCRNSSAPLKKSTKQFIRDSDELMLWWDPENNEDLLKQTLSTKSTTEIHWICPDSQHPFTMRVREMTSYGPRCPNCLSNAREERKQLHARLSQTMGSEMKEILRYWDDSENDPQLTPVWGVRVKMKCAEGHSVTLYPYELLTDGCSICRGLETRRSNSNSSEVRLDPEIAEQWHPTKNGKVSLTSLGRNSNRLVWWVDQNCGFEWQATPRNRVRQPRIRCPKCDSVFGSLAYVWPEVAAEWSEKNPVSPWQISPSAKTPFEPEWVCIENNEHIWTAKVANRTHGGAGCPICKPSGTSKIEKLHAEAAISVLENTRHGRTLRHASFSNPTFWKVDITALCPDGREVVIEYDGSYWHRDKTELDTRKSLALLNAGFRVIRLREHPLEPLTISDPDYREFHVFFENPNPTQVINQVKEWITLRASEINEIS